MCKTCGRSEDSAGVVKQLASEQWNRPERLASAHAQSRIDVFLRRRERRGAVRFGKKLVFTGFDSAPCATRGVNGRKQTANCAYLLSQMSKTFLRYLFTLRFWATVCKTVRPMLSDRCLSYMSVCLSVCPVCDVGVLWPNGWMDQDETWHAGRPRPWPHCVTWGSSSPPPKGRTPNFRPISVVPKWLDESRCHLVGR